MTIRFKCPHCKKTLSVKDHLAGKKAACPACKKPLKIPTRAAAPVDVEDLAASALADAPAAAEPAKESKPIKFTCTFCDAEISVPFDLGGKQTPCPECKRIVKVPKPVADKPKDWRAAASPQGPAFARQNEPQAPEGAWEPAAARKVSQQALAEAGALPEVVAEPVGVGVWIRRGVYATLGLVVVIAAVVWFLNQKRARVGREELTSALAFVEPTSKLGPEATAAVQCAAGSFYARKSDLKKALEHLGKARARAEQLPIEGAQAIERDALLGDVALAWVELGGRTKEGDDIRRSWQEVQDALRQTLQKIQAPEARVLALRKVLTRLGGMGKEGEDTGLGLTIKLAGLNDPAGEAIGALQKGLLVGREKVAAPLPPRPDGDKIEDLSLRLTYAEVLARQGKYDAALEIAARNGPALHRVQALTALAGCALDDRDGNRGADIARQALDKACDLAWAELRANIKIPVWNLIALGRGAARAGLDARVREVLERLPDKAARGRVQLEALCVPLERAPAFVDPAGVSLPEKESVSYGLALQVLARHNTRVGSRSKVLDSLEGLEDKLHPFVLAGVAQGDEDAARR
jgi:hypothetical protein